MRKDSFLSVMGDWRVVFPACGVLAPGHWWVAEVEGKGAIKEDA